VCCFYFVEKVIGVIGAAIQHVAAPRLRIGCLEMLQCLAPLATPSALLELIVPYIHQLLVDQAAPVRRQAIITLSKVLRHIDTPLPQNDSQLFQDYLFPQLSGLVNDPEPMVLVALAQHVAHIARSSALIMELTQQAGKKLEKDEEGNASLPFRSRVEGQVNRTREIQQ
tara:strand:- start:6334 stop:6840 length:507 start_codon:yes stop_codon:yes gene_type:complete